MKFRDFKTGEPILSVREIKQPISLPYGVTIKILGKNRVSRFKFLEEGRSEHVKAIRE